MTLTKTAKPDLVTINIDGRDVVVSKGTNVIEAAKLLGIEIPHYCYHQKLTVAGNCRMCLIEAGIPAVDPTTGKQKISWIPRPQIGCGTNASPGLHIRTNTPMVKNCREGVTEMLLINHPLDCPICDQAGECKLQEHSTAYGRGYSRFIEQKNVKPKRIQLGPRVTLDDERCILCSRCIRFSREVAKDDVLGFVERGSYSTLTCYPGKNLENNYSLNTVDICPVGALSSTDFRFKMRVWFLKTTSSIDTESSVGANTTVWSREGVIYRITPRQNDEVNDVWMTDSGRLLYKKVRADDRLLNATVRGAIISSSEAIVAAADLLKMGGVAVVGSARSSVEEQFLTKKAAEALQAPVSLVSRVGEGDNILLSADRNPNVRGALVTGLISELPKTQLAELGASIDSGEIKTVLSMGEDLVAAGLSATQIAALNIVYIGSQANPTSAMAKVVIPSLTVFEKNGTFVNQQFRLQKFSKAVPGPTGVADDKVTLSSLLAAVGDSMISPDLASIWMALSGEAKTLAAVSYESLPDTGLLLDFSVWAGLPFVEGETLHYKPTTLAASCGRIEFKLFAKNTCL